MFAELSRMDYSLREYQQSAKNRIFAQWDRVDNVMYQMPTGTGKTRLFTSIIRDITLDALERNQRSGILIIAHRTELIEQISRSLDKYRVPHGIIAGSFKNQRNLIHPVQVASIQTITHTSNYDLAQKFAPRYIIIDEAHHAIANSYTKLWQYYPKSKKLGVTATPWRMDGRGFCQNFDVLIPSSSIKAFLADGWLAPYKYFSVPVNDSLVQEVNSIKKFGVDGDYQTQVLENIVDTNKIRAQLLRSYFQYAKGKKGIIYSISRAHSKHICQQYSSVGISIADIDSSTPAKERQRLVADFKEGKLDILVNVDIFSEGFDCPDLEFVQLARPTRSLVKYIQQIGRGLRKNGDKQCIILDNVGMYERFGLPDDDRPWESYFMGTDTEDNHTTKNSRDGANECRDINSSESDLTEGSDQLILIQDLKIEPQLSQQEVIKSTEEVDSSECDEMGIVAESTIFFAKYKVIERSDGYTLVNTRTGAKQHLCGSSERNSIALKIVKMSAIGKKSFALISSYNRDKSPTASDRIIGEFKRDGQIIRFICRNSVVDIGI